MALDLVQREASRSGGAIALLLYVCDPCLQNRCRLSDVVAHLGLRP